LIESKLGFNQGVAVEDAHSIDADHALDAVFALLGFVGGFLGPDEGKP
jgi:hypothetical protein